MPDAARARGCFPIRSPGNEPRNSKDREWLLIQNRTEIEQYYLQAVAKRVQDPAVFVLDTRDPVAFKLVADLWGADKTERHRQTHLQNRPRTIPTVILSCPGDPTRCVS